MTINHHFSLFISSKIAELAEERRAVKAALEAYKMNGWLWEDDAFARPEPVRSTYLDEVASCDIYIGLFWLDYGAYTIEEFEHARGLQKPCLIYEKCVDTHLRDTSLKDFLIKVQGVDSRDSLTIGHFETTEQLAECVQRDVQNILFETYHKFQFLTHIPDKSFERTFSISEIDKITIININTNQLTINQVNQTEPDRD